MQVWAQVLVGKLPPAAVAVSPPGRSPQPSLLALLAAPGAPVGCFGVCGTLRCLLLRNSVFAPARHRNASSLVPVS